jgi:hypothetical protein
VVSRGEFQVFPGRRFGLSVEIFGNWKTPEAKNRLVKRGWKMVKRGEMWSLVWCSRIVTLWIAEVEN